MFDAFVKVLNRDARETLFIARVEKENIRESYRIALLALQCGVDPAEAEHCILRVSQGDMLRTHSYGSVNVWRATAGMGGVNRRDIAELGERLDRAYWQSELDYDMARFQFATIAPSLTCDSDPKVAMSIVSSYPVLNTFLGDEPVNMRVAAGAWGYHFRRAGERALVTIDDIDMVHRDNCQRGLRDALRSGRASFLIRTSTWMRSIAGSTYTLLHHNEPLKWTATFEAR